MEIEQIINEIKSDILCKICFEKFIKLTNKQFDKFYKDNEELLPETFEDENCCRCYEVGEMRKGVKNDFLKNQFNQLNF